MEHADLRTVPSENFSEPFALIICNNTQTRVSLFHVFTVIIMQFALPEGAKCREALMQVNSFNTRCVVYWSLKVILDQRLHANEGR